MVEKSFSRRALLAAGMGLGVSLVVYPRPLAACESEACENVGIVAKPKTPRKKSKRKPSENCAKLNKEMQKLDRELGRVMDKRRKLYKKMQDARHKREKALRKLANLKSDSRQLRRLKAKGSSYVTESFGVYEEAISPDLGKPIMPLIRKVDRAIKRVQDQLEWIQSDYETALYDRRQLSKDVWHLKSLIRSYLRRLKRAGCYYEKPKNLHRAR